MAGYSPNAGVAGRGDSDEQSPEVVFTLLANQRRRDVLACLEDTTQSIPLAELAEDVAVRENGGSLTEGPNGDVQTIQLSLHHVHLPKLADAGAVEYDWDRNQIRASEPTDLLERSLSLVEAVEDQ